MNIQPPIGSPSPLLRTPDPGAARRTQVPETDRQEAHTEQVKDSLWEILTPEEREFFENQASMGPMTYRPNGGLQEPTEVPTGRRIDVRG